MQNNILSAKAENYDVVFKLQDTAFVVELTCNEKDFMLAGKFTPDCFPNEVKFLFKTPAKLFAKLGKNIPKNMSVNSENQLIIPMMIDDEQIIVPFPVSKLKLSFELKCERMAKTLKIKDQIIEKQEKQIATLWQENQKIHQKVSSSSPELIKNQSGNEDCKKLKQKYDEARKNVTNYMFQVNRLEQLVATANTQNKRLQDEIKVMKESTDKVVELIKIEHEKEIQKKQIQLQTIKKQSENKIKEIKQNLEIKEKSPKKVQSSILELAREEFLYMAKIAEQTERFEDMVDAMNKVVAANADLTVEERSLLSVAYKNTIFSRKTAWRALSSIEKKEEQKGSRNIGLLKRYKAKVEGELNRYCNEILYLIDSQFLVKSANAEARVFYYKIKGDYYRYMSEYTSGAEHNKAADQTHEAYKFATENAEASLKTTHPIRLGLALNYSVFYYEVKNDPSKACQLSKQAFDDAIADIDQIEEDQYKDATTIIQLIRDNLKLWTSELQENGDE